MSNTTSAVCQHAFYVFFLSFYFHSVSCQSVGKKLAVVEVCVGRQVDRVRGRERRQAGEQEQVINNRLEEAEDRDRDIRPYSAKAEQYGECSVQVLMLKTEFQRNYILLQRSPCFLLSARIAAMKIFPIYN